MEIIALSISAIALVISGLSGLYARWSAVAAEKANTIAVKANEISSLNSQIEVRKYIQQQIEKLEGGADFFKDTSGMVYMREKEAELHKELENINKKIETLSKNVGV